jgi:hypothetical protein
MASSHSCQEQDFSALFGLICRILKLNPKYKKIIVKEEYVSLRLELPQGLRHKQQLGKARRSLLTLPDITN